MNDENHEFDPRLQELFRREHTHLPAEPFSSAALRAITAERTRAAFRSRSLQAAAVVALLVLSPVLVAVSARVARWLDPLLELVSAWLTSPPVLAGAALCALAALATKWARVW
jgi:hypothetical protein